MFETAFTSTMARGLSLVAIVVAGLVDVAGIEPATPCLQSRCSPS